MDHVNLSTRMLTTDAIHARLTDVFRDVFDDDALVVGMSSTASDVEGWDSLSHVRLMLHLEREFKIKFTASEIGRLKTVGDLIELIRMKSS